MKNELSNAVTKLLNSDRHTLKVTAPSEDSVLCSGMFQDHFIEVYASIRRSSFYELCNTATDDKPCGHLSIKVDTAQAMSTDVYGDDIEYMKDQIYYLTKKLRQEAVKRTEAYNFLMNLLE